MNTDLYVFNDPDRCAIKATENEDGSVTLSGLAVVFDEPGTRARDLTGEYFTAEETYYGAAARSGEIVVDAPFHHHIPLGDDPRAKALADALLGQATMRKAAEGWLAELVLPMRQAYEEEVAELAAQGALGWSIGTAGHMYRADRDGMIRRWPIIEVSPTPTPAEPRTFAGVKSAAALRRQAKATSLYQRIGRVGFDDAPAWQAVERRVEWDPVKAAALAAALAPSAPSDEAAIVKAIQEASTEFAIAHQIRRLAV